MKRPYQSGTEEDVKLFIGVEVERTPAFNLKTLFVVGFQPYEKIKQTYHSNNCEHIFFGANHSYNPHLTNDWEDWETMIVPFLKEGYICTLDIPLEAVRDFNDNCYNEYNNFIPQIRIPIPYIRLWNYNTMLKIDDSGFNYSNPGVWCHNLHDLMDRSKFTDWPQYNLDRKIN